MLIVVDTTETFQHPHLESPEWRYLESFLNRDLALLVVPEIVIAETVSHFPSKLSDGLSETRRSIGRVKKLLPEFDLPLSEVNIESATTAYEASIRARLQQLSAITPAYNHLPMERIIRRSLQCRKPFDANGHRGLRDTVLWETVLELAINHDPKNIVIITGNTNDFGPHNGLAKDLMDDLDALRIPRERIKVCNGLSLFNTEHVKPVLDKLNEIQKRIQDQESSLFDVVQFYREAYQEILCRVKEAVRNWGFQELGYITRGLFFSPGLANHEDSPKDWNVGEVYRTEEDEVAFSITFLVQGAVDCVLPL